MGNMAYSLQWVMQDLYHQQYLGTWTPRVLAIEAPRASCREAEADGHYEFAISDPRNSGMHIYIYIYIYIYGALSFFIYIYIYVYK